MKSKLEKVDEVVKGIDWSKTQLVIGNTGVVVLNNPNSALKDDSMLFSGVCLGITEESSFCGLGQVRDDWFKSAFTLLPETDSVTLSN